MQTWSTLLRCALISSAALLGLVVSCQVQREGERCSLQNGNADCQEPLMCTAASSLNAGDGVNRCCPNSGTISDDRCRRRVAGSGGMGGQSGAGGGAGNLGGATSSGGSSGDAQCQYTSDCQEGLVCGPGGRCQPECRDDRDCDDGLICSVGQNCVTP